MVVGEVPGIFQFLNRQLPKISFYSVILIIGVYAVQWIPPTQVILLFPKGWWNSSNVIKAEIIVRLFHSNKWNVSSRSYWRSIYDKQVISILTCDTSGFFWFYWLCFCFFYSYYYITVHHVICPGRRIIVISVVIKIKVCSRIH